MGDAAGYDCPDSLCKLYILCTFILPEHHICGGINSLDFDSLVHVFAGCTEMNGMRSSQLISSLKLRDVEAVPGNRNDFLIKIRGESRGDPRIDARMSTDDEAVPVTRVVLTKEGDEDVTFVIKYKQSEKDDTWETYETVDGKKVSF